MAVVLQEVDRPVEPRTTASEGASCARCGVPLQGRKERFCSDRRRMRVRRERIDIRRRHLFSQLREVVAALEDELVGEVPK